MSSSDGSEAWGAPTSDSASGRTSREPVMWPPSWGHRARYALSAPLWVVSGEDKLAFKSEPTLAAAPDRLFWSWATFVLVSFCFLPHSTWLLWNQSSQGQIAKTGTQIRGCRYAELNGHPCCQLTAVSQQKFWNEEPKLNVCGREQSRCSQNWHRINKCHGWWMKN